MDVINVFTFFVYNKNAFLTFFKIRRKFPKISRKISDTLGIIMDQWEYAQSMRSARNRDRITVW